MVHFYVFQWFLKKNWKYTDFEVESSLGVVCVSACSCNTATEIPCFEKQTKTTAVYFVGLVVLLELYSTLKCVMIFFKSAFLMSEFQNNPHK